MEEKELQRLKAENELLKSQLSKLREAFIKDDFFMMLGESQNSINLLQKLDTGFKLSN